MKMKAWNVQWLLVVLALFGSAFFGSAFAQDDGMQFADESYDEAQEATEEDEAKSDDSWDNDKTGEMEEADDEDEDEG
jgi:hypothetical protein